MKNDYLHAKDVVKCEFFVSKPLNLNLNMIKATTNYDCYSNGVIGTEIKIFNIVSYTSRVY